MWKYKTHWASVVCMCSSLSTTNQNISRPHRLYLTFTKLNLRQYNVIGNGWNVHLKACFDFIPPPALTAFYILPYWPLSSDLFNFFSLLPAAVRAQQRLFSTFNFSACLYGILMPLSICVFVTYRKISNRMCSSSTWITKWNIRMDVLQSSHCVFVVHTPQFFSRHTSCRASTRAPLVIQTHQTRSNSIRCRSNRIRHCINDTLACVFGTK